MAKKEIRIKVNESLYTTLKVLSVRLGIPITKIVTKHILSYLDKGELLCK